MKFVICSAITKVLYKRILRVNMHVTVTVTGVGWIRLQPTLQNASHAGLHWGTNRDKNSSKI